MFDQRLKRVVVGVVDTCYGFENGLNQAIELSGETLSNVKFVQERKLISNFFDEIARDTGKVCYGIKETFYALENGAVATLIVWENLDITRVVLMQTNNQQITLFLNGDQIEDTNYLKDPDGNELEVVENQLLGEWLAENYKKFGASLQFVTDKSQEGSQFVQGFGGVGGLLRYQFDFSSMDIPTYDDGGFGLGDDDDGEINEDEWEIFY